MDEILNLIESVSEGFPSYSYTIDTTAIQRAKKKKKKKEQLRGDKTEVPPWDETLARLKLK